MLPTTTEVFEGLNNALDYKFKVISQINKLNEQFFVAKSRMTDGKNRILNEYNDLKLHPEGQKALGPNEAARNATIDSMLASEKEAMEGIEMLLSLSQGELSLAHVNCDRWRYALRILEVNAGTEFSVTAR